MIEEAKWVRIGMFSTEVPGLNTVKFFFLSHFPCTFFDSAVTVLQVHNKIGIFS